MRIAGRCLLILLLLGWDTAQGRLLMTGVPTERIPNMVAGNLYPRWLGWTGPYPQFGIPIGETVPRFTHGGNHGMSVGVDSRNVAHLVNVNQSSHGSETPLRLPEDVNFHITYKNTHHDARMAGVVGLDTDLDDTWSTLAGNGNHEWVSGADIAVDSQDRIHVVWIHAFQHGGPTGGSGAPDRYRVFYRRRDAGGWSGIVDLSAADLGTNVVYDKPRIKVGTDGVPHVVAARQDLSIPENPTGSGIHPGSTSIWHFQLLSTGVQITDVGSGSHWGILDGEPRLALTSTNTPYVVWTEHYRVKKTPTSTEYIDFEQVFWSTMSGTQFVTKRALGIPVSAFGGSNFGPNVTVGPDDVPYFVYTRFSYPSKLSLLAFQSGEGGVQQALSPWVPATVFGNGAVVVDSRNQVHVLWKEAEALMYAARVKNPDPLSVNSTWSLQRPAVVSGHAFADPDILLDSVAISKNDQIHVTGDRYYTRTMEYGLGNREAAVMANALPGAAVNLATGNFFYQLGLYSMTGAGPSQSLGLAYNSLDIQSSSISLGWRFSLDICLIDNWIAENNPSVLSTADDSNEVVTVFFGDGRPVSFHFQSFDPSKPDLRYLVADDEYGYFSKLERTSFGNTQKEYKLTTKHGEILWFNWFGRLRRIEDAVGNYMDLFYESFTDDVGNTWYRLKAIADQLGNGGGGRPGAVFEYEPGTNALYPPRPTTIHDPGGRTIRLAYQGDHLSSVTFSDGPGAPSYGFEYSAADSPSTEERVNQMRRLLPPRGSAASPTYGWTCFYLPDGRLKRVEDPAEIAFSETQADGTVPPASVAALMIGYDETHPVTSIRTTYLTDRRGFLTTYSVEPRRSLTLAIQEPNPAIPPTVRYFDPYGNLIAVQDRWGGTTLYTYQVSGAFTPHVRDNLLQVQRPLGIGSGQELVVSYTYSADPFNQLATETSYASPADGGAPVARTTTHIYNQFGQQIQVNHPDVQQPDGTTQAGVSSSFEYNGPRMQLTRIVNEEGHWIQFSDFDGNCGLPGTVTQEGGTQTRQRGYDVMGKLFYSTEPNGGPNNDAPGSEVILRDTLDRIVQVIDPAGAVMNCQYDVDSNLITTIPPVGGQETTAYDRRGFVSGGTNPDGSWLQWVDSDGNVRRIRNLRGFETNSNLDYLGRVTETRVPGASTVSGGAGGGPALHVIQTGFDLIENGYHLTSVTHVGSPANRVAKTYTDNRGRQVAEIEADGFTQSQFFYDEQDQIVAQQKLFGSTVQECSVFFRDARDRVNHVRRQDGPYLGVSSQASHVYFVFNRAGSVIKDVDPLGNVSLPAQAHKTTYVLDARERVTTKIDGKGMVVREYAYGDDDLLIRESGPDPATKGPETATIVEYSYTARKEVKRVQNRNGAGTSYYYTPVEGQLVAEVDALGRVKQLIYDPATQHVSEIIEANGTSDALSTLHFWSAGLLTETRTWSPKTQAYDIIHRRYYDQANRLERDEIPGEAPREYSYNDFSDVKAVKLGAKSVAHTYNGLGQAVQSNWSGAYSIQKTRTFNGQGQMDSMSDGSRQRRMLYDTWKGAPAVETFAVGAQDWKVQTHSTDDAGNVTGLTDSAGSPHAWPVDENNQVIEKQYGGNASATLSYTPGGLLDQALLKDRSGVLVATTTFSYDGVGRKIRALTVKAATGEVLTDYQWEYNDADEVTKSDYAHLGGTFDRGHDNQGRVVSEVTPGNGGGLTPPPYSNVMGSAPTGTAGVVSAEVQATPRTRLPIPARTVTYTFDPGGNRTQETVNGVPTTMTYDEAGRLIHEISAAQTVDHEYDDWGNRTVRRTTVGTNVTTEAYGFDESGRMSAYTNSATGMAMQYDDWPTGERYAKTDLSTNLKTLQLPRFGQPVTEYTQTGSGPISLQNSYVQDVGAVDRTERIPASGEAVHYLQGPEESVTGAVGTAGSWSEKVQDSLGGAVAGGLNEPLGPAGWQDEPQVGASLTPDGGLYVPERGITLNHPDDYAGLIADELYESQAKARREEYYSLKKRFKEASFEEGLGYWIKIKEMEGHSREELQEQLTNLTVHATTQALIDIHEMVNPAVAFYKAVAGQDTRGNKLDWRERVLAAVDAASYVAGGLKGLGGYRELTSGFDFSRVSKATALAKETTGFAQMIRGVSKIASRAEELIESCVGRSCFVAGTQVLTDDGKKNIEEIVPGDRVLSRSDSSDEIAYRSVIRTFVTHPAILFHVSYRILTDRSSDSGNASATGLRSSEHFKVQTLSSSGEHPFWLPEQEAWIPAKELRVGDILATPGATAQIIEIRQARAPPGSCFTTYNFEVEQTHSYYVLPHGTSDSALAIWVHNSGRPCEFESEFHLPGGGVDYGSTNSIGQRSGIRATIVKESLGTGSDAMIRPPGFRGLAGGHARSHLLARVLGGLGNLKENIVTLFHNPVNNSRMKSVEMAVKKAVDGGEVVNYWVTPVYRPKGRIPIGIRIEAQGSRGFSVDAWIPNRR